VPYSHGLGHDSNPGRASIAAAAAGLRRRAGGRLGPRPRFDRRRRRRPAAAGRRRCSGPAGDSDPGRASINATAVGLRRRAGGRLGPRPRFNRRRRRPPAAAGRRRCSGPAGDSDPGRASIAAAAAGLRRRAGGRLGSGPRFDCRHRRRLAAAGRRTIRTLSALQSPPQPPATLLRAGGRLGSGPRFDRCHRRRLAAAGRRTTRTPAALRSLPPARGGGPADDSASWTSILLWGCGPAAVIRWRA